MHTGHVSTPFGRRQVTLALVKGQQMLPASGRTGRIEKWKVFRDVCEARERFHLQDRAIAVLDALLTFYPETQLDAESNLIVFPSNAQLSIRAHGITESTLRRQLNALVEAGLIQRRDSPNGKRYAHRSREGEIEQAYGFDLSPLVHRAHELAGIAQEIVAERIRFRRTKEALTICRRDVRKLISAAIEEGAAGNWTEVDAVYTAVLARLPRHPSRVQLEVTLGEMELLREEVLNRLDIQENIEFLHGNAIQNDRHIQNSNTESIHEFEPRSRTELGASSVNDQQTSSTVKMEREGIKAFPLGIVIRACPQIADYCPGGIVGQWRDLMSAAVVVRSMLGVSASAYEEACGAMGPENAAVAMACILERSNLISSAGGYLRDLTKRSLRGEFSLGPMLMALLRVNGQDTVVASLQLG